MRACLTAYLELTLKDLQGQCKALHGCRPEVNEW